MTENELTVNTSADNSSIGANVKIIRDPALSKSRIFVGNLPCCTREELESICHPYGKVLGSLVQKNYGFVQFESEELANKVASALTKSTFKGNIITVRNAGSKPVLAAKRAAIEKSKLENERNNDCEIIVTNRKNTKYAEYIEEMLKQRNLRVDVLFPNEHVPIGKVLASISASGCRYAVVVNNQHEEHNSITVNILYGEPAEHRNMPVEDAVKLIGDDFRLKVAQDGRTANSNFSGLPQTVPVVPAANFSAPPLKEPHPESMQILLNLLAKNQQLTVTQYDRVIQYLQDRRVVQLKVELGTDNKPVSVPDPEIELQKKILSILNKPSVTETHYPLLYPSLQAVAEDYGAVALLKDVRVQKALDAVMKSSVLVSSVERYMKF